ncbi:EamA family transporter RarD [Ponticaulis sp.]|uniref:EamA family transporter RarD n=1 Tax=Ponticaulis sp. TaxID=2020902 RepID=UPI000B7556AE|nr:EamA family transporter RarD [Ponticaulis sp.]MAI89284.1 protein RarD [Ponticaulis sp.]OUY01268.1 MAG: protein RarD [Hyphomonadaceae bacterium TMED5]
MTPDVRMGFFAGISAYFMWGVMPIYFKFIQHIAPTDILGYRILWSIPTGMLLLAIAGRLRDLPVVFRSRNALWLMASSFVIGLNWLIYIWAVNNAHIMQASLGYFMNPLVNVGIGAIFLSERLRPLQWGAVAIAATGVAIETFVLGELPWVSLVLCFSFAFYGLIRRRVQVDSRVGLTAEVLILLPAVLIWFAATSGQDRAFMGEGLRDFLVLALAGPVSAIPLILFALGAKRLRFSTIGIMQYLAPSLQFLTGLGFGETLTPTRLITFAFIWTALVIFTLDALGHERQMRRAAMRPT